MKLSDFVINFLEKQTDAIFLLPGGGIMHLVDSVGRAKHLRSYCFHHEQSAATAAEGYARMRNRIGVVLVTSGPGATNAITGAAAAWLDSIPMLIISGQVKTDYITPRKNGILTLRALGFQELNIIDLVKPICKYARTVDKSEDILFHLEKAVFLSITGRPGPSWLEIPLDIQAGDIHPASLRGFKKRAGTGNKRNKIPFNIIKEKLETADRPLLLAGNGIRLAGATDLLGKLLDKLRLNAVTPIFTADDLVTYEYPYYLGRQGIPGNETANWAVDNCDLLLVVGDRLQLTQTSYDYRSFAPQAFKIMVDIDENELRKKTLAIDLPVCADAKDFLQGLYDIDLTLHRWDIKTRKIDSGRYLPSGRFVNVYKFLEILSRCIEGHHVATANGMASLVSHQALEIKKGQRFLTNAGLGQMGSGLPLAIGACVASGKPVVCMEGDGSLMLNIQELQTVFHHRLPVKLFIWNNQGYYSIRSTHRAYFGREFASGPETGISFPDFGKLAKAWGFPYWKISSDHDLDKVKKVMKSSGPQITEIIIDPFQPMLPKWSAGRYKNRQKP